MTTTSGRSSATSEAVLSAVTTVRPAMGTVNQNVLPAPTSLSTQISPPKSSTIRLDRVRPRPVPSLRRTAAALLEGLEDAVAVVRGDPDAGVGDAHGERVGVPRHRTATVPPAGVNFTALERD